MFNVRPNKERLSLPSFLLAAVLLLGQISAWTHGAEHGFDEHTHDGVECSIAILGQQLDDGQPETLTWSPPVDVASKLFELPSTQAPLTGSLKLPTTRGPPTFS